MNFDEYLYGVDDGPPITTSVPVPDTGSDSTITCDECESPLSNDDECYVYTDGVFCIPCGDSLAAQYWREAMEFAKTNCLIHADLPKYEGDSSLKPTPEQYAAGDKISDTPNAHLCRCRHEYTNYDHLVADLDTSGLRDLMFYSAIKSRTNKLVAERLEQLEMEDDELTE